MALGNDSFGRGSEPVESTDAPPVVERAREYIASPSFNKDGTVTHRDDAVLGYEPGDVAPVTVDNDEGVAVVEPAAAPAVTPEGGVVSPAGSVNETPAGETATPGGPAGVPVAQTM